MVLLANWKSSENHLQVREYSTYRLTFGLFWKRKKICCAKEAFRIILLQRHKKFAALLFFLAHAIKKHSGQMRQISRMIEMIHPYDWLKTGWARDSQTRTRLVDSLICITCSLENNAFSVLHYVMVALHYSMLHRFEIFSAPGTIAHGSIRLPPRSLASSRGC